MPTRKEIEAARANAAANERAREAERKAAEQRKATLPASLLTRPDQ
jgi:hypothetical protein